MPFCGRLLIFILALGFIGCGGGGGGDAPTCTDSDGDGYSIEGGTCGAVDCNDNNSAINPGATEICDSADNDCDSAVDEGDVCGANCTDSDGDGYSIEGGTCGSVDCNDNNSAINPGAIEVCDSADNDCDSAVDEGDVCGANCTDSDGDGYSIEGGTCGAVDCNDGNSAINPGATEVCDSADNDCDSAIDEGDVCGAPTSKLSDTGQTESYTSTPGEDSDYNTINQPSFTRNADGTVTDNVTGLLWQLEDDNTTYTWDAAATYCDELVVAVYSDWRLPTKRELMRIVDYGVFSPAIDPAAFRNVDSVLYWSITGSAGDVSFAWGVNFDSGNVIGSAKSGENFVRCVRGQ